MNDNTSSLRRRLTQSLGGRDSIKRTAIRVGAQWARDHASADELDRLKEAYLDDESDPIEEPCYEGYLFSPAAQVVMIIKDPNDDPSVSSVDEFVEELDAEKYRNDVGFWNIFAKAALEVWSTYVTNHPLE